jgi:alginate O-acetyltransferase complex protein AlgI
MIFPSYSFIFFFLPIFLIIWHKLGHKNYRYLCLTIASYIFYAYWDYRFLSLLLLSTLIDYHCGYQIFHSKTQKKRKLFLILSLTSNLGILFFFKYFYFFSDNLLSIYPNDAFSSFINHFDIVLPVGISFYTFQSMSYSIDIYTGKAPAAKNILYFSSYVSMFPQLIAGPIIRYQEIEEQLHSLKKKKWFLYEGLSLFILGVAKKLLIADSMDPIVYSTFDSIQHPGFFQSWLGVLSYSIQLYFDFSGYSDMALGLGMLLGFKFPINFNSPYKAKNISDFWRRWHISLSNFLRDYLFIPLGGSRVNTLFTFRNLIITMFLGGLWHGASWNFVIWGLIHGLYLVVHSIFKNSLPFKTHDFFKVILTYFFINLAWIFFRAEDLRSALVILSGCFGLNGLSPSWTTNYLSTIGELPSFIALNGGLIQFSTFFFSLFLIFFVKNSNQFIEKSTLLKSIFLGILFGLSLTRMSAETPFLYFQF